MSEKIQLATEVQSAATAAVADAELTGFQACEDDTLEVTLRIDTSEQGCDGQEPDNEESEDKEPDTTPDEQAGGRDATNESADATPSGLDYPVEVNGVKMDYNDLQKAVSDSQMEYPSPDPGHKLLEMLESAVSAPETTESTESDANDTETGTNDQNDSVSDEYLISGGVSPENLEAVRGYRSRNGECAENGCVHGANDDSDYCASHPNSGNNRQETPADNRELSDLSKGEKASVKNLMEQGCSKQEALDLI